jgi:hypothetical protein
MRIYQQLLLVAVLTVVFVLGGMVWVRSYMLPPVAAEAARKAEPSGELPTACYDELAGLESGAMRHRGYEREVADGDSAIAASIPPAEHIPRDLAVDRHHADRIDTVPETRPEGSDDAARPIAASALTRAMSSRSSRTATLPVSVENPVASEALASLQTVDVLDLMRQLRSDTESVRTSARSELMRRGFSEVDFELARQLCSPDAETRKQLARAVPRLASVDAVRWLMWLAADPQPDVRMAAISTLATTADPSLLDRVEAMARKDTDEQIQAMAAQIARQRDLTTSRGGKPLR